MTAASHLVAGGDSGPGDPQALRLQVMGTLRAWRGDTELDAGPRQQRCLLAVLLARAGRPIAMTDLIDLIWGPGAPPSAVNVIHKYVGALRRLLEPDLRARVAGSYLFRQGNGYRFAAGPETLDLISFRRRVAAGRASVAEGDREQALDRYVDALQLCHGHAGEGLSESAAATATFAAIDGEFYEAAAAAAEIAIRVRRPSRVLAPLRLATRMGPLNEPVHTSLMTALAAAGHQAEALAVYRTIRDRLAEDLGIDPGHDLQEAHRRVLNQTVIPAGAHLAEMPPAPEVGETALVPSVRPAQLPPDLSSFVGREAELDALRGLVAGMREERRSSPLVVAMDGMGGVGKSTLATHFAHLVAAEFPDGQLYLDLQGDQAQEENLSIRDALPSLLYALGVPASNIPETCDARIGTYRSLTAGRRFLVLLDNVRDSEQVRPLLPNSAGSLVLITSRRPLTALAAFDGAHLVRVDVPDMSSARALLARRLAGLPNGAGADSGDGEIVDEIIELCGRLPLALVVLAARLIARPRLSLATVLAELRDGAGRLEAFPGVRGVHDPRTAFSWSYRQLSEGAAGVFRLLAVAPGQGLTVAACVSLAGDDADRTRAAVEELAEAALVTESENGHLTSHVLVRAYAEELLLATDPAADRQAALTRLLQYYLHSSINAQLVLEPHHRPATPPTPLPGVVPESPATQAEALTWFAGHLDALDEAVRVAAEAGHGTIAWQLAITLQRYLQRAGYIQHWENVMRVALRAARETGDEVGEAHVLRSLAGARYWYGAYDEALRLLETALRIYTDHGMLLEQGLVHANVRIVHDTAGDDESALVHSEKAATLLRAAGDSRNELTGLKGNGKALARIGRSEEAAETLWNALDLSLRTGSLTDESEIRDALGRYLVARRRPREAIDQFRLAAEAAAEAGHGPMHVDALLGLLDLLIAQGDSVGAREILQRTRALMRTFQDGGTEPHSRELERLAEKLPDDGEWRVPDR